LSECISANGRIALKSCSINERKWKWWPTNSYAKGSIMLPWQRGQDSWMYNRL